MTILQVLSEIASISGDNDKKSALKRFINQDYGAELQTVLYLALSPRVKYYIKRIPEVIEHNPIFTSWEEVKEQLQVLSRREKTGNEALQHLESLLTGLSPDDAEVVRLIIGKDLKIGMGATSINKVCPGLIEETPYMGAVSYKKEKVEKLFKKYTKLAIQTKMDGRYCNAILSESGVYLESRSGEETFLYNSLFATFLKTLAEKGYHGVLTGELTIPGIDRYQSNGIITSLVILHKKQANSQTMDKEIAKFEEEYKCTVAEMMDKVTYTIWDCVSLEGYSEGLDEAPYADRLSKARTLVNQFDSPRLALIETKLVYSIEDAMTHFKELLQKGEEGAILKATQEKWKDGKPAWQVKLKLEVSFDLKVTGFQKGTPGTKNEGKYSVILLESLDGKLKSRAGGLKEIEVDYITNNAEDLIGTVAEIRSCGITKIEGAEHHALLHPSFVTFRDDKAVADTLEQCLSIEEMALGLK